MPKILADLPYPIREELLHDGVRVVVLAVPVEDVYNRNVFGLNEAEIILWQIDEMPFYPGNQSDCPFVNVIKEEVSNDVILFNWCSLRVTIDVHTGQVRSKVETR